MIDKDAIRDAQPVVNDVPFAKGECSVLYVGTAGNITAVLASGKTVTFANVPAGLFRIAATMIVGNGTTALNLVAGYV